MSFNASSIVASTKLSALLEKLHALWSAGADDHMRDKFVALEPDKCQLLYLLARSMGALNIVEAGTSFGVSTMYLALAVGQNIAQAKAGGGVEVTGKVIATEKEATKAAWAREYWKEAGEEVEEGMPEKIDLLLLDIWTPMALPTLKIIQPRLRRGAVVIADNVVMSKILYKEFLTYVRNPENGFKTMTVPYSGGLEVSVYLPDDQSE
ncbi:hypothetical protein VE04_09726 [Pseudogymnoascus sp. 24MN13]|nr:hypothetical protein VE04_09726 [Pseudogymnoascus sp. 24MN13]